MEKVNYYRIICIFLTSAMERREAPAEKETIPSLLLVNEDVISPLRLVFDTTEKMVASLTSPQPQLADRVQDRAGDEGSQRFHNHGEGEKCPVVLSHLRHY